MTFSLHRGQPLFYSKYARQIGAFPQGSGCENSKKHIWVATSLVVDGSELPRLTTLDGAKTQKNNGINFQPPQVGSTSSHQPSDSPSGSPSRRNARRGTSAVSWGSPRKTHEDDATHGKKRTGFKILKPKIWGNKNWDLKNVYQQRKMVLSHANMT